MLLDHGLYKELDDFFRLEYCRLWEAIVLGDKAELKRACASLNVGPAYALFASVLTLKPFHDIIAKDRSRLQSKSSQADNEMLKVYASKYYGDIALLLGRADSELLLLLKTNDCLRHIDKLLGAPINTTKLVAQITGDVLLMEELWPSKAAKRPRARDANSPSSSSDSHNRGQGAVGDSVDKYQHGVLYATSDQKMTGGAATATATATATGAGEDDRPEGGLGFWLHARTQRALLRYCSMQWRKLGLGFLEWISAPLPGPAEAATATATAAVAEGEQMKDLKK